MSFKTENNTTTTEARGQADKLVAITLSGYRNYIISKHGFVSVSLRGILHGVVSEKYREISGELFGYEGDFAWGGW